MSGFDFTRVADLPEWVQSIIRIAKKRARHVGWSDHQPEMVCTGKKSRERLHHSFAWSIELDDLINEGCLA